MFRPLFKILQERVKSYDFKDEILSSQVVSLWRKIIEKELGSHFFTQAKAVDFRNRKLRVVVSSHEAVRALKQKDTVVKNKINSFLKRNFISSPELDRIIYRVRKEKL